MTQPGTLLMNTRLAKPVLFAAAALLALSTVATLPVGARAQSSRDMSVLTDEQRADFNKRLQGATSSADRARITSELNRAIQQRKMELRRLEREKQGGKQ